MANETRKPNEEHAASLPLVISPFVIPSRFVIRTSSFFGARIAFIFPFVFLLMLTCRRSLGEGGCSCFVSRLEFSRKINHKWTRIDTNFMERLPANDPPSLDYGEAGANGREISI